MLKLFRVMIRRDLLLAYRQKSDVLQTVFFFLVVITLVPLGVGAETELLRSMAPGIVWVAALLAALLSLPRLFAHDFADGTLESLNDPNRSLAVDMFMKKPIESVKKLALSKIALTGADGKAR